MALSQNLLAVIEAYPSLDSNTRKTFQETITANTASLDDLYLQSTAAENLASRASIACAAAQLVFGTSIVIPGSSNYTAEKHGNWSSDCWLPAACIIKARSAMDVALALLIVTTVHANFAVRSAGHNANSGFSSVGQQGVLLDLGEMNQITFNEDNSQAFIGPGSTWDEVYGALEAINLTVAGGRSGGVGVGGLILGGGMSHFSNQWGMVCDNVLNFEVVLADSTIVMANAHKNVDLFKALKGGGPNFGIVTRFDMKTFPGSELWFQFVVYSTSDKVAVMAATVKVQEAMLLDDRIGFFLTDSPGTLTAGMIYRGEKSSPTAFEAFDSITPLMVAVPPTSGTFKSCAVIASLPNGQIWEIGALSVGVDASLYVELHDILTTIPSTEGISLNYTYQPFSVQGVAQGKAKGGNSLNITSENQAWLAITSSWTDPTLSHEARAQVSQLITKMSNAAAARGKLLDFIFMNDANSSQSPIDSYGAATVHSLEKTGEKFDPLGVFQNLQNSGFLLSRK